MRKHARFSIVLILVAVLAPSIAPAARAGTWGTHERWRVFYDGPAHHGDRPRDVAFAPDSSAVYVTGESIDELPHHEIANPVIATVAYDADTGHERWVARESLGARASVMEIVVSPDGGRVFVAMQRIEAFVTVAYDAATGHRLWRRDYVGPGGVQGFVEAIAISPDGGHVYVVGDSDRQGAIVAYDAETGSQEWAVLDEKVDAFDVAVDPGGQRLYVAESFIDRFGLQTRAYDAATGQRLWTSDAGGNVVVDPAGTRVYVNPFDAPGPTALRASDGAVIWSKSRNLHLSQMTISPEGNRLYFAQLQPFDPMSYPPSGVAALKASTGQLRWSRTIIRDFRVVDLGVNPQGTRLIALGDAPGVSGKFYDRDFLTISMRTNRPRQSWRARFGRYGRTDQAVALDVSGDGSLVVVTGTSHAGEGKSLDFATVAYDV